MQYVALVSFVVLLIMSCMAVGLSIGRLLSPNEQKLPMKRPDWSWPLLLGLMTCLVVLESGLSWRFFALGLLLGSLVGDKTYYTRVAEGRISNEPTKDRLWFSLIENCAWVVLLILLAFN